ncbi:MAG: hypothetical protein ACREB9_08195, partial [Thermoplasmata archaeon]
LVRFGYDGEGFAGWARQPGRRTVEGTIRDGVERHRLVRNLEDARIEVASRTDAGVSARANAIAIRSELPVASLVRALNGLAPDIYFDAARPLPEEFRVRHALWREYRYFLDGPPPKIRRLRDISTRLPHQLDTRTFGRGIRSRAPVLHEIDILRVRAGRAGSRLQVRAHSFVWGMIRKIVAGMTECAEGRLPLETLLEAVSGRRPLTLPLAAPDPLILWEVRYPGRWTYRTSWRSRDQQSHLADGRRRAATRLRISDALMPDVADDRRENH